MQNRPTDSGITNGFGFGFLGWHVACSQPNAITALKNIFSIYRKPETGGAAKYAKFLSDNRENIKMKYKKKVKKSGKQIAGYKALFLRPAAKSNLYFNIRVGGEFRLAWSRSAKAPKMMIEICFRSG